MKFHTELHLTVDGEIIKFTAYEILKIAMELVNTPVNEEIFIPQVDSFDTLMEVFRQNVNILSEENHRLALVVPLHLQKMNTPKKWLYIAQSLAKQYQNNPLLGWWSKIGRNLIFIKNSDKYLFYVSDHGNIQEVFEKISDIVWGDVNWLDSDVESGLEQVSKELKSSNYSQQFTNLVSSAPLQELRDFYLDWSEEDLQQLYTMTQNPDFLLEQYDQFGENTRYILNILGASYKNFVEDFPEVIKEIYVDCGVCDENGRRIQYENGEFWTLLFSIAQEQIKGHVLYFVAREVNQGKKQSLLRPINAFGGFRGDPYRSFYNELMKCTSEELKDLNHSARMLLRDEFYVSTPNFLPNLVAAWFIAEPARNLVALLTNLLLLDLIESSAETDNVGQKIYSWTSSLVHPDEISLKPDQSYRNVKGGLLPMCHDGAVEQSKVELKSGNNQQFNKLRKKECRILIEWLCEFMIRHQPDTNPQKVSVEEKELIIIQDDPLIEEISKLDEQIKKEQEMIKNRKGKQKNVNRLNQESTKKINQYIQEKTSIQRLLPFKEKARQLIIAAFKQRLSCLSNLLELSLKIKPNSTKLKSNRDTKQAIKFPDGLKLIKTRPNGDCLFESIAAQTAETAGDLRQLVCAVLLANSECFRDLIEVEGTDIKLIRPDGEEEHVVSLERYIELMSLPGTWGSQIELAALAQVLHMPIVQVSPGYRPLVYPSRIDAEEGSYYEGQPIFLYYNGVNHYDILAAESTTLTDEYQIFQNLLLQSLNQINPMNFINTGIPFFKRLHNEYIIEHRHEDPNIQREYDSRFGLIKL